MDERWATIEDEPRYAISNIGRILNTHTGRILKQDINNGYCRVNIRGNNYRVHRLVGMYFCPGYSPELDINHLDGDKTNNAFWNLKWTTRQENIRHAFETGLSVSGRRTPVRIVETGEVFESQMACAEAINGYQSSINAVLKGKVATHRGYTFEYA